MTNEEIYAKVKEQLPYYTESKRYKASYDLFIDLTMSCDREEAMAQCTGFLNASIRDWDIFGILAAYDLREYLQRQNK